MRTRTKTALGAAWALALSCFAMRGASGINPGLEQMWWFMVSAFALIGAAVGAVATVVNWNEP